ncbi:hypothetical protein FB45DRAFT_1061863 [Roridomyces roridus]|uniref:GmrSD restriction endonucleases N-terminal domain-containing protein n=1 Tax=Roridomyces roridus TaxID=1738132 RepID=A0AAD7FGA4_9AGAR|nr:hypothetical protein FB45DRAFT_1061863 [Roridomyces roridus]
MISDESELTDLDELSSEYGTAKASKSRKGKGKARATGGYRLQNALKAPRATTYSTESLYKQIVQGTINLEPDYQREVVWTEAKQVKLIDSIFRNFYIPPVIFAVNTDEDGTETRTCIDGKQRLTSIYRFLDGLIPHKDAMSNQKLWYKDNPNTPSRTAKRMLPKQYCNMFDTKAVVCVEYEGLRDADEREIFQRVQLGVALTPAEKLKVLKTPRAAFVRKLQDTFLDDDSPLGGDVLAWDRSRGSDFRCLAQTIQCIAMNPKTTSIQATEKWLSDTSALDPGFAEDIENTYQVFAKLVASPEWSGTSGKPGKPSKVAPVEFISMGQLVHRHKRKLTMSGLAAAVIAMRRHVRDKHDDIRNNGKVYKTVVGFIDGYKASGVPKGEMSASAEAAADPQVAKGTKRKRRLDDSDDDSDEDDEGGGKDDADYAPAKKRVANASVTKSRPTVHPLPTPPISVSTPAPTESTNRVRAFTAKVREETSGSQVPPLSSSSVSTGGGGGASVAPRPAWANAPARGATQQQQYGALEAGLMGGGASGGGGWGGGGGWPQQQQQQSNGNGNGMMVKQEDSPGAGGYGYSGSGSGSNSGQWGSVKGENGSASGRYSNGSSRGYDYDNTSNSGRERDRDRDRERDGGRERDRDRGWSGYRDGSGGGGSRGGGGGGRGGSSSRWS